MESLVQGKRLGRFALVRRLAVGGMAEIWLAHGPGDRDLALKILPADFAKDPGARAMFFDEVNIASRLEHPNIVQVLEAFESEGHLAQAMELIDGRDLRRVLSAVARVGQRMPIPIALRIGREIARALEYAHAKTGDDGRPLGIIHRDVSPHNVMITRDGVVKLLDFGIARAAERITRTRHGVIKGKLSYMAPEQALALNVSQRSDIFSAGIVLWEMLAMQRLFKEDSDVEIMERVVNADVPPLRTYCPDVPEDAAVLLGQMLSKRESLRPESMRAVGVRIEAILDRCFDHALFSQRALASWVAPFVEEERRTAQLPAALQAGRGAKTQPLAGSGRIPEPELIDGAPSGPVPAADRTVAMGPADLLGASGAHRLPQVTRSLVEDLVEDPVSVEVSVSSSEIPLVDVANNTTGEGVVGARDQSTDKMEAVTPARALDALRAARAADQTLHDLGPLDATARLDAVRPAVADPEPPTPAGVELVAAEVPEPDALGADPVRSEPILGGRARGLDSTTDPNDPNHPRRGLAPADLGADTPADLRPEGPEARTDTPSDTVPPDAASLDSTLRLESGALPELPPHAVPRIASETPTPGPDPRQLRNVRRPTRSEIVRYVDGVPTVPVSIDQAVHIPPPKPAARIFDNALKAKVAELAARPVVDEPSGSFSTLSPATEAGPTGGPARHGPSPGAKVAEAAVRSTSVTLLGDLTPPERGVPAPPPERGGPGAVGSSTWVEVTAEDADSFAPVPIPAADLRARAVDETGRRGAPSAGSGGDHPAPRDPASSRPAAPSPFEAAKRGRGSAAQGAAPDPADDGHARASRTGAFARLGGLEGRWAGAFIVSTVLVIILSLVLLLLLR